ncbi:MULTISPECIES: NUDIX domain-containing protein [unclassified Streptomyces]|uniref:NUDIX domain-containing protein n=1 Tax=unclassified Streptomyces TaxID=2593676 RepID=UPI000DAC61E4|nr:MULTISPECIES: NUDIX domain-containing protein [unclassified Streptomyces]PZT73369.1 NUDIX hydrolase [Streptomyces sp. AC1-42T]PZT83643.1 NUDIX hydrolase [Streptomyces sp. AC1-42W]
MPPSRSHIRATAETYLARHTGELDALNGLFALLDAPGEPSSRATLPTHVTCSAVVIDRERRVLHIRHPATGLLVTPGGHVEAGDRTLLDTALREVCEGAGIRPGDLCLTPQFLDAPIDVELHDIGPDPANAANAANAANGEPAHRHVDFRFVFYLAAAQPPTPTPAPAPALRNAESADARWLPFADVRSPTLRAKLLDAETHGLDGQPEPVNAGALIHDGVGRYLLHLRDDRDGIWEPWTLALLGGGREPGDSSLEATLRRELAEEAPGLRPVGLTPYAVEEATGVDGLAVSLQVFEGFWNGDPEAVDLREGVLLKWFAVDALDRLRLSPGLGDLIRRHAAEHPLGGQQRPVPGGAPAGTVLHVVGVHLYLEHEGRVLLGLRHPDSAYAGELWHTLAGHLEAEAATAGLAREAFEEAGLVIDPADLELVHTVHTVDRPGARPRIQLFFRPRHWEGTPEVREPDRCLAWEWWDAKDLPEPIVPYTRVAIEGIRAGRSYSELGWER